MRWYCVSPSLPRGAQLRVREAPSASAAETSPMRLSISDVIAVCSPPTAGLPWLSVMWQQQQGFVMATTPDDMPLLVPWETTGILQVVFAYPETTLHHAKSREPIVLEVDAYLGVIAETSTDNDKLLVMYQGDQYFVSASDTVAMAERIAESMTFMMNPTLPENATIVVRQWPDRESDQVDVITHNQEVSGTIRSEDWIKLHEQAWVMWKLTRHNNLQLLQPSLIVQQQIHDMMAISEEDDKARSNEDPPLTSAASDPMVPPLQDDWPIRPAAVAQDGPSGDEDVRHIEKSQALVPDPVDWDNRPIQGAKPSVDSAFATGELPQPPAAKAVSAWDDRPIRPADDKAMNYDDRPIKPAPLSQEDKASMDEAGDANAMAVVAVPAWDDRPIRPADSSASMAWDDRPIKPSRSSLGASDEVECIADAAVPACEDRPIRPASASKSIDCDDRPIKPAPSSLEDESSLEAADASGVVDPNVDAATSEWDDRPIRPADNKSMAWDDRPIKPAPSSVEDERPVDAMGASVDAEVAAVKKVQSWDERPIKGAAYKNDASSEEQPETASSGEMTPNQSPTQASRALPLETPLHDAPVPAEASEPPTNGSDGAAMAPTAVQPRSASADTALNDSSPCREARSSSACSDWEPVVLRRRSSFEEDAPIVTNQVAAFEEATEAMDDAPRFASRFDEMIAELSDVNMMWLLQLDLLEELFHHLELHALSPAEKKRTMEMLEVKASHVIHAKVLPSFLRFMPFVATFMASDGAVLGPHMEHLLPPFFALFQERSKAAIATLEGHLRGWLCVLDVVLVLNSLETALVDLTMSELGVARLVTWFAPQMPHTRGVPKASPRLCDALVQLTTHRATKVRQAATDILANILGHHDHDMATPTVTPDVAAVTTTVVEVPTIGTPEPAPSKPRMLERKPNLDKQRLGRPWQKVPAEGDDVIVAAPRKPWQRQANANFDDVEVALPTTVLPDAVNETVPELAPTEDVSPPPLSDPTEPECLVNGATTVVEEKVDSPSKKREVAKPWLRSRQPKRPETDEVEAAAVPPKPWLRQPRVSDDAPVDAAEKATEAPSREAPSTSGEEAMVIVEANGESQTTGCDVPKPWLRNRKPKRQETADNITVAAAPLKPWQRQPCPRNDAPTVVAGEAIETPSLEADTPSVEAASMAGEASAASEALLADLGGLVIVDDDEADSPAAGPVLGVEGGAAFKEEESADEDVKQSWFFVDEQADEVSDDPRGRPVLGESDGEGDGIHALSWEASPRVTVPVLGNTVYDILGSHPLEYFSLEPPSAAAVLSHRIADAQVYDDETPVPDAATLEEKCSTVAEGTAQMATTTPARAAANSIHATDASDIIDTTDIARSIDATDAPFATNAPFATDAPFTTDAIDPPDATNTTDDDPYAVTSDADDQYVAQDMTLERPWAYADDGVASDSEEESPRRHFFRGRFASNFDEIFPEDDEAFECVDDGSSRVHSRKSSDVSCGEVHRPVAAHEAAVPEGDDEANELFEPEAIDRGAFFDGFTDAFPGSLDPAEALEAVYIPLGWWLQDCQELLVEHDERASLDNAFCMLEVAFPDGGDDAFFWDDADGDDVRVTPSDWAAVVAWRRSWQQAKATLVEDLAAAIARLIEANAARVDDETAWATANTPVEARSKSLVVPRVSVYGQLPKRRSETLPRPSLTPMPSALQMPPRIRTSSSAKPRSEAPESPTTSRPPSPKPLPQPASPKPRAESPRRSLAMPRPRALTSTTTAPKKPLTASALAPPTRSLLQRPATTTTPSRARSSSAAPQIPAPRPSTMGLRPPSSSLRTPASRMSLPKPVTRL
ncbi:hypothetical protein ACHHYP_02295 [Achlya hypogyna]|uniref:Uncharacterized protein n=1 Tax=Achlya hypogyna TaxID=1202772 RepID=A0A1V9Z759_ACHHY|nr:hypothetical protein ACHHYP_02295 [Achlya hypogyna]